MQLKTFREMPSRTISGSGKDNGITVLKERGINAIFFYCNKILKHSLYLSVTSNILIVYYCTINYSKICIFYFIVQ